MKLSNKIILLLIILVASALRFYNIFDIPYTHDEFSALFRTHFNNFSDLIAYGVKIDTLPAGVQVFLYYWTIVFGDSEWVVKTPFILSGILSVYLIYLIGRVWYNETVALISASFLASIQYTIMYSQIARPYTSGLFLCLLMVYFWTKIMLSPELKFYRNSILFVIAATLCAYNHHFSLLFAAIVGISGVFYINKEYLLKYILSGILIFLLYIPHLSIFIFQLNMGGNEDWLGTLHNDFIIKYFEYVFNFSTLIYILVALLFAFGFYKIRKCDLNLKFLILSISWFTIPFLIGFMYSKYMNNVMQFSVLIFSFPFLLFILFGHIKPQKNSINLALVLIILSINTFATISTRKHYETFYKGSYEQILVDFQKARAKYPGISSIIDSDKDISKYYIQKHKIDTNFIWFNSFKNENEFIEYLEKQAQTSNYLYFGCLSTNMPTSVPIIQDLFPVIEIQNNYAGATTFIFSKGQKVDNDIEKLTFDGSESKYWSGIDQSKIRDSIFFSAKNSYLIDEKTEWSPTYTRALNEIRLNENNFVDISVKALYADGFDDIVLVASLDTKDTSWYWGGTPFGKYVTKNSIKNKWITIHHSIKLSDVYINEDDVNLKVYIWNKGKKNVFIDDFKIELRTGNPVIYSLNEDF